MTAQARPDYIIYKDMGMIFVDQAVLSCIISPIPPEKRYSDQSLADKGIYNLILYNDLKPAFILVPKELASTPAIVEIYEANQI